MIGAEFLQAQNNARKPVLGIETQDLDGKILGLVEIAGRKGQNEGAFDQNRIVRIVAERLSEIFSSKVEIANLTGLAARQIAAGQRRWSRPQQGSARRSPAGRCTGQARAENISTSGVSWISYSSQCRPAHQPAKCNRLSRSNTCALPIRPYRSRPIPWAGGRSNSTGDHRTAKSVKLINVSCAAGVICRQLRLKQGQLLPGHDRAAKTAGVEGRFLRVDAEPLAGQFETAADCPGVRARAAHTAAPGRVIFLSLACRFKQREHMGGAVGHFLDQPLAEDIANFQRQPKKHIARASRHLPLRRL